MNRIKEVRKQAGIKQTDLCAKLGISQGALSGWENEKYEPGRSGWLKLSEVLGVSVDYLMGGSSPSSAQTSDLSKGDVELLEKFHALDSMAQARILNTLDFECQAVPQESAKSPDSAG